MPRGWSASATIRLFAGIAMRMLSLAIVRCLVLRVGAVQQEGHVRPGLSRMLSATLLVTHAQVRATQRIRDNALKR
jgi:hypothetical protein